MTDDSAIEWLLTSPEPAVRNLVRRDVLGERADEPILDGPWVRALFAGQRDDGGFGGHPYKKWVGPIGAWCPLWSLACRRAIRARSRRPRGC